ncbi:MAG: hypothetical protein EBV92_13820, partial [Betaproteobacteria bacterium]|nr:hypothetical protein [Betaproteobacteria bacterium]
MLGVGPVKRSDGSPSHQGVALSSVSDAPSGPRMLLEAKQVSMRFDVSEPWLNRLIERKPRRYLVAVDQLSFAIMK